MPNQPNPRATDREREVMRDEMKDSIDHFRRKAGGSLLGTFIAHVQSPEGKPLRDFGAMVDQASGGLLAKALKGIMAPDEPSQKTTPNGITVKVKEPKKN